MKKFIVRILPLILLAITFAGLFAGCGNKRLSVELVLPYPCPEEIKNVELRTDNGNIVHENNKIYFEDAEKVWFKFECLAAYMPGEVTLALEGDGWNDTIENATVEREEAGLPLDIDGEPGYIYHTEALNIAGRKGDATLTVSFKSVMAQFDASFDVRGRNENSVLAPGEVPSFDDVKTLFNGTKISFTPHRAVDKETGKSVTGGTKIGDDILNFAECNWFIESNGGIDFKMELPLGNNLTPYKERLDDMFALYWYSDSDGWNYADQNKYRTTSVSNIIFEWKFSGFDCDFLINIDLNILHEVLQSLQTSAA